ncbi:MAG: universal stress protein, partial [Candidatus Binatota bacterium]
KRDVLEYSYVRRQAEATRRGYGLEVGWDVLHGDPGEGICNHVQGRDDVILAMTTRARAGLEQAVFGSVTSECVRRAGVLLLVYWPRL